MAITNLTDLLRRKEVLSAGRVQSVHVIFSKTLYVSTVSRVEVRYSNDATDTAPRYLFLKMAKEGAASELGGKEVEFYQRVASRTPGLSLIRCYDAEFSSESGVFHLLLDDLSDTHFQTNSPTAPSKAMALAAVKSLADFHAFWWEHPDLGKTIGKLFNTEDLDLFVENVEENISGFLDLLGEGLAPQHRRAFELVIHS